VAVPGRDGTPYAAFTYACVLEPAGSYSGDAAVALLRAAAHYKVKVRDLIADRGYTNLAPEGFCRPVRQLVTDVVGDLLEYQRKRRALDYTLVRDAGKPTERLIVIFPIAGSYFADSLPEQWHDLARPGLRATQAERAENRRQFDQRAKWAFTPHGRTEAGTRRWAGPATSHAGFKVRCPNNSESMRQPYDRPLTTCTEGIPCSCGEVVAIDDPQNERSQQRLVWGTTKWTKSYNRRTVVERSFADDKYQVSGVSRGSICCFGTVKQAMYCTSTIVARNLQVALRWYRDQGQPEPWNLDEISRPGYDLPEELGGLHAVEAMDEGNGETGVCTCGRPSPEPDLETSEDSDPAEDDGQPAGEGSAVDVAEMSPPSGLSRAQRRLAERKATKAQRSVSKPPKPPPRGAAPA